MIKVEIIKDGNNYFLISDKGVNQFELSWSNGLPSKLIRDIENIFELNGDNDE